MRILYLTHRLPYAPNRGDRIRALHVLRALATVAEVDLVSLVHDADEASHAGDLRDLCASVATARAPRLRNLARGALSLATSRPLTHALLDAPGLAPAVARVVAERRPDVVLAFCSGMARIALEPPLDAIPLVLDLVDVDSAKWAALARVTRAPKRWIYAREARLLGRFEAEAARRAHATTVVNERERVTLARLEPGARCVVVENGIDLPAFRPPGPPADEPRVVFSGVMSYAPNEEAALWFAREAWPAVRAREPRARFSIVGAQPTRALRALPSRDPTIEVTGSVPEVAPHLWRAAVSVAPIATARGVQNKVLEAIAAGLPCVVSPAVVEGLPPEALPACDVADTPAQFAAAVGDLLALAPAERRARAARADLRELGWAGRLSPLVPLLAEAAGRRTVPVAASAEAPSSARAGR